LIELLAGREVAHELILPTRLVVRESSAKPPKRSRTR
jgi:hypothetical protein